MEGGRKGVFFLRAFAQRATPKYHNYVETQNTGKKKKERNVLKEGRKRKHPGCAPKGVPHRREQEIRWWKDEEEIQIAPPIEWVPQRGIFRLTQKENAI